VYSMGRPLISGPGGETLPARFPFAPLGFGSLRPRVLASRSALALASPQSCFCVHRGDASLFQRFMVRLFRTPPVFPSVRVHRIYFDILVPGPPLLGSGRTCTLLALAPYGPFPLPFDVSS
jgi:hypothetical protein